jgi:hypothetical protein
MSPVRCGQVWDYIGEATDAPSDARGWRCLVWAPNDSTEAGADSWVMWCGDPPKRGRWMYMHHRARVAGKWRRVSWWRQLCDWIWRGDKLLAMPKRSKDA